MKVNFMYDCSVQNINLGYIINFKFILKNHGLLLIRKRKKRLFIYFSYCIANKNIIIMNLEYKINIQIDEMKMNKLIII